MISYLIKSGLCLALLLAFYHWVLEREKMHQFNRFYLLGSVLLSFIAPALIIYVEAAPVIIGSPIPFIDDAAPTISSSTPEALVEPVNYLTYFFWVYVAISSILFIRFAKSLHDITQKIRKNKKVSFANAQVVLVEDTILPHTFWNYIFINKEEFQQDKIEKELFTHELTHVTQKHTLDVVLVEALQVVLWFNPFFYPLKKAIQLNHEFLADDKVIASHNDIPKYQYLLLDKAAWKNNYYLASNLNYSLTKKRLLMMKRSNSKVNILLKKLAIIPLVAGLVFVFSNRVEAQKTNQNLETEKEILDESPKPSTEIEPTRKEVEEPQEKIKFHKDWYIAIDGEKYYYTFDKYERVARYYKNGKKLVNLDIVKEYKRKHKIYKDLQKEGVHYVKKSKAQRARIDQEFSDLGGMYFRMPRSKKNQVTRPVSPVRPYLRIVTETGKVYYKLKENLTDEDRKHRPPTPPFALSDKLSKEEKEKAVELYEEWAKRLKLIKKD